MVPGHKPRGANPAEQRGEEIRAMVAQQPRLSGVMPCHQRPTRTTSWKLTRSRASGAYCCCWRCMSALFFSSFRPQRNALLLSVSASLFVLRPGATSSSWRKVPPCSALALIAAVLSVTKQPPPGAHPVNPQQPLLSVIVPFL
ncbi:hypothetical protein M8494_31955 [Serratia ureilytica]